MRSEEYITEKELSELFNVCMETVRRWRSRDGLPYIKAGKKIFIKVEDFTKWFEERKK